MQNKIITVIWYSFKKKRTSGRGKGGSIYIYQIYHLLLGPDDCIQPQCGELSEYIDCANTEVEDLSSRYMNGSNV